MAAAVTKQVQGLRAPRTPQALLVGAALGWLVFCTWMFHGVLEVQLRVGSTTGVSDVPPSERRCTSWLLQGWCQRRVAQYRAQAVRQGMQHAWAGYKAFAWGADEIHPKSKTAKTDIMGGAGIKGMGVSMVDALSTLKVMGLHEQFQEGRDWVVQKLDFEQHSTISFFETVIRILGGLLAAHDLSGDPALAVKAQDLADRLLPAFDSAPTGLISNTVSLPRVKRDHGTGTIILAEMGTNVLEFASVARITEDPKYREKAEKGLRAVHAANKNALLFESVDRRSGVESGYTGGVGAGTDSYYEYLIKYWVLGGRSDEHFRARWEQATDEALAQLMVYPPGWPFSYVADSQGGTLDPTLEHLRCFYPGSIALGVMSGGVSGDKAARYLEFAGNMTQACFQLYNATGSGLGAERITFDLDSGEIFVTDSRYWQRPEVIESIFYMWRATHDQKWRDMGWQMWRAIGRYARQEGGYSGSHNADQVPPPSDDVSQSWFFAETLKYFYLLFSPDNALSLTDWVLNTEAHPLRAARPSGSVRQRLKSGQAV
ncbi:mannosyl-oligosaccharide 1,2-alpha-mannosidase MNS1-like [Micractinium conductrix]|uniref:alpha-1,2-Mannosidase n=1 Tax=Micractinium conductrix TaxID=554055 RepID=A0A2P6VAK2_9CHLO|nr:mannosyl-oligosaccharide 1,2-alpha-mannosidase MNS1-like [Micractinium conductrix]|eukprot:PSC71105.1 mannosyl-oligosaccharide 1,2-alpha-mannosidase MNS1-like [Micractinium conductrix]